MSSEENKAFVRQYFAALSGKDKPASVVNQYVGEEDAGLRQHIVDAERGFPHYELIAEEMIAEGDQVVVKARVRGTHAGEFVGIPASGRQVNVEGVLIYRITNGKITEHWMLMDNMTLLQQIGALPAPNSSR
jgi:steroid delta-isomerase-like uncharacterized protein